MSQKKLKMLFLKISGSWPQREVKQSHSKLPLMVLQESYTEIGSKKGKPSTKAVAFSVGKMLTCAIAIVIVMYLYLQNSVRSRFSITRSTDLNELVVPVEYKLFINASEFPASRFSGAADISVMLTSSSKVIELNAENLAISSAFASFQGFNVALNSVAGESGILLLKAASNIPKGQIVLKLRYSGEIGQSSYGFFRSPSRNNLDDGATQFQPFGARQAFPCFDLPRFKASYVLTIAHPSSYIAKSNALVDSMTTLNGITTSIFNPTIRLPTYLVAWSLSQLNHFQSTFANEVYIRIWSDPVDTVAASFILHVAAKSVTIMSRILSVDLPNPKIDILAASDFPGEGMENNGLIIMSRQGIFGSGSDEMSLSERQYAALLTSHEIVHHWLGNLVTPYIWDELWISEGFAEYFQAFICNEIFPEWDQWSLFAFEEHYLAFNTDTSKYAHPLFKESRSLNETYSLFDDISYNKGASVIRMMVFIIGEDIFFKQLGAYVNEHALSSGTTKSLLDSISLPQLPVTFPQLMYYYP